MISLDSMYADQHASLLHRVDRIYHIFTMGLCDVALNAIATALISEGAQTACVVWRKERCEIGHHKLLFSSDVCIWSPTSQSSETLLPSSQRLPLRRLEFLSSLVHHVTISASASAVCLVHRLRNMFMLRMSFVSSPF